MESMLEMSEYEVYQSYKNAKEPKRQIGVLADLNACSKKEIQKVIKRQQDIEKEQEKEKERLKNEKTLQEYHENVIITKSEETFDEIETRLEILDALISKYTQEYISLSKVLGARACMTERKSICM